MNYKNEDDLLAVVRSQPEVARWYSLASYLLSACYDLEVFNAEALTARRRVDEVDVQVSIERAGLLTHWSFLERIYDDDQRVVVVAHETGAEPLWQHAVIELMRHLCSFESAEEL